MQYFQNFEYEIKINIFKYVDYPLNLISTCRNWSVIAKDSYAKTKWLIEHHGKEHAFFHAVRLGVTFIDMTMCQSLIERKIISSRYFIQVLLKHFRMHNQRLIELSIGHNFDQFNADKNQSSWARNLIIFAFNYLLNDNERQLVYAEKNLPSKDMRLTNLRVNNDSAEILKNNKNNLKDTEGLIINKFITLSSKSPLNLDFNSASFIHQPLLIPDKYLSSKKFDAIKFLDFLQQNIFLRPLIILPLLINNVGIFGVRPSSKNVSQRRRDRVTRQQNTNRIYKTYRRRRRRAQFNEPINNEDTLNSIANLPRQASIDPLIHEFFNGATFYYNTY
ncbi:uncharacterized protein OCT59_014747 [Rhizophagus irregularis]|uniref:F-box domain-containing protein n=2 Tax=Rhizophagus irregularis TaxID=588596 RepID=A0A015LC07_RHIIW|nr:hypothetical protein GLOIN_2v1761149 [Rhizophagus irregularis DAOM 181602=DAOM 197198]EXX52363.1 hypothetical protein RirG_253670 [Rhizophagus irregularis DAOM 197198w]UZO22384.1 hypothetical protein OCT59_014747 [Rhizophagus irregularis]POG83140.1 hypothetical protein GLOIN_2v1761149 [Rhizophagus irregularis DAOM 181602=DAOM 197198]CAB5214670.1 unnamed protein product [Rhizophagus irregularis]GBC44071.1 hypothetical protein GLOIN_2v1761149 [Rhizophagus irregularis DAOM 181602=DAOM 197198]|eukprot:XP_025190006.1 hypothetical protein GLOIN_2v1761149 [Rhizophagus irregularis DAOM 181602=DAOM 197198]